MSVRSVRMVDAGAESSEEEYVDTDMEDESEGELISDSEDGDDDDVTTHVDDGAGSSRRRDSSGWKVLTTGDLQALQVAAAVDVASYMGCSNSDAKTILMHYRWDRERVLGILADKGPEELFHASGVPAESAPAQASTSITCEICCDDVPPSSSTTMGCGHTFCNSCWVQHFKTQIGEGQARYIKCMAYKCGAVCNEERVLALLSGLPEEEKYREARLLSFVEDNATCRFCPSVPWCGRAIQVDGDVYCEPECSCGTAFCFKCGKAPHSPCTCTMWEQWDEKISGDSETRNWIVANTKPCPKCGKPVEKNGGCNLVVCKCSQAFCWLCGASTGRAHTWTNIEGHSCGRWKDEVEKKADEAARSHKRYMHYFERYKLHTDSHQKEISKRADLLKRIESEVESARESRDYGWLIKALDQLKVARGVLAPSYVFAYFFFQSGGMFKDDFSPADNKRNQDLFEDQQQMLEQEVERLSGLVQSCSESLTCDSGERIKVINSSANIEARIIRFYGSVEELLGQLQTCSADIAMYKPRRNHLM